MLKIKIDGDLTKVKYEGPAELAMAEMFVAVHTFYNKLSESDKKTFKESFMSCADDIFSDNVLTDDDINMACEQEDMKVEDLINCLDAMKDILKELTR